jgi:hypothetical protein
MFYRDGDREKSRPPEHVEHCERNDQPDTMLFQKRSQKVAFYKPTAFDVPECARGAENVLMAGIYFVYVWAVGSATS